MSLDFITRYVLPWIAALSFWCGSLVVAYKVGLNKLKSDTMYNKYKFIYAPLRTILLDKHISTYVFVTYPQLSMRIKNALPHLRKFKFKKFFEVLFKKYIGCTEIEFGGNFPTSDIMKIIKDNPEFGDAKLLNLIQSAERSRYESYEQENQLLTSQEFKLTRYINNNYEKLNKKFI